MYLRFVFAEAEPRTRRRLGILRDGLSLGRETEEVREVYAWLNAHLPIPPKESFSGERALCWFKMDARNCITQVRELAFLLAKRGERIWQIYSRNPGLITYEDEYQIVAVPDSARMTAEAWRG
jgi:hypothetical protein